MSKLLGLVKISFHELEKLMFLTVFYTTFKRSTDS